MKYDIITRGKGIKSLFLALMICAMVSGFSSCDLEEYNPSGTTPDNVFSTPEGFGKLVNACYMNLRKEMYGREDVMYLTEAGTDLWFNAGYEDYNNEFMRYKNLNEIKPQLKNFWNRLYDPINYCNAAINRAADAGFESDEKRDAKVAEAHFLRAFFYWHIVETFGGVTLSTTETSGPILKQQRSPISAFYELIVSDLEFAAQHLPVVQDDKGRICKKAAYHMLSRAYLTMANYCQMTDEMKDHLDCLDMTADLASGYFQKSLDAAKYLIDNQASLIVSLYPTFADLFNPVNNKTNHEALFIVSHSETDALNPQSKNPNRLHMWYLATYDTYCGLSLNIADGYGGKAHMMPTRYLLTLFDENMDGRYYGSFKEVFKCNYTPSGLAKTRKWKSTEIELFKKRPPISTSTVIPIGDTALYFTKKVIPDKATRKYGVVDIEDLYYQGGDGRYYIDTTTTKNPKNLTIFFPSLIKFADPDRTEAASQIGEKDVIVLRLGETYLLAAEAAFGLGDKETAASYVNVLRERASLTPADFIVGRMKVTAADMSVDFFLEERARELCGEHMRWYDLKRYGKLASQIYKGNPDISLFEPHHILRPIPQVEMETLLNSEEYGQNKGY